MCQVVDRELDFVSVFGDSRWDSHDTSVANENVKLTLRQLEELLGCLGDRTEGSEIAWDKSCIRGCSLRFGDDDSCSLGIAIGKVDMFGIVFCQLKGSGLAESSST
jgi:hypothetical protein